MLNAYIFAHILNSSKNLAVKEKKKKKKKRRKKETEREGEKQQLGYSLILFLPR